MLEYRILGPLDVRRDGESVAIHAPRQRALLGFLLLRANEPVPRDELIDQLWGDEPPATARASLHNHVHALRKIVGAEQLEFGTSGYVLRVERDQLDLERFERLAAEARRAEANERALKLREALACWRGPPLVEFPTEPFAQHEINRLEEERLAALEDRIDADLELGRHVELVGELESLVERYPLRERLWAQLMLALYRAGRQADALAAYRRARERFAADLGLELGVVLRELQRAILIQDPALDDPEGRVGSTLERAAAILPRDPSERAKTLYDLGISLMRLGDHRRAVDTLGAAARLADATGAQGVGERARLYLSYLAVWSDGKSPLEFLDEAERASQHFEAVGDRVGLAVALRQRAQMLLMSGRADAAATVVSEAAAVAAGTGDVNLEASCRAVLPAILANGPGPVDEVVARSEAIAAALPDEPRLRIAVLGPLALLHAEAGHRAQARQLGHEAVEAARGAGLALHLVDALVWCAAVERTLGNFAEAGARLRSAYALRETDEDRSLVPDLVADLAATLAVRDDAAESDELARHARARAGADGFAVEVNWRRALALVAARAGRFDEAALLAEEARIRTAASDWLSFHGETLETAAAVHSLAGDAAAARTALEEALAAYEQKGNVARAEAVRRSLAG